MTDRQLFSSGSKTVFIVNSLLLCGCVVGRMHTFLYVNTIATECVDVLVNVCVKAIRERFVDLRSGL